ncbi:MAG: lysophospholipid acyltransferase family protein [Bradymonadia bacterium]
MSGATEGPLFSRRLLTPAVALLISLIARLILVTLRIRRIGPPFDGPGVIAFWHGQQLPLLRIRPERDCVAPVSLSSDGDLQVKVLERFGIASIRGSSSRRSVGLTRGLLRALKRRKTVLIAVDGPRGPRCRVKDGAAFLARLSGTPVWCVSVHVARAIRLRTAWDHFIVPLPFSLVTIRVSDGILFEPSLALNDCTEIIQSTLESHHNTVADGDAN